MIHVQMAGIRNKEDALMCVSEGVDIIGLLVGQKHTSDDFLTKEEAKIIKDALPNNIKTTLITHLEEANEIIEIAKKYYDKEKGNLIYYQDLFKKCINLYE